MNILYQVVLGYIGSIIFHFIFTSFLPTEIEAHMRYSNLAQKKKKHRGYSKSKIGITIKRKRKQFFFLY